MTKTKKRQKTQIPPKREVDVYFETLAEQSQNPINRVIQYVAIPVFSFAVLGLVWMIPFPEIGFLKRNGYDTFLNWGSFFIAGFVYYYLRLATTLSYAVLLTVGVFSFFIVRLEYVEQSGGPTVWFVCSVLLLASFLALYLGKRMERNPVPFSNFLRMLVLGPIWLWHFVFKKLNVPY
ncbi:hypothetical protein GCM10011386_34080 [Parapedobacter defluvii]|uniref:DUF962 domain-containing protein n=1 Tax=Parapedobacter defluvii TaxID=2045106 RepID=A0ABQ1ML55_9SPHI|nr:Mpo1-like protein [Parapedobacter defluvii]RQP19187.1 MAG: DUF962 domain-containing protein [Parapedobacter sp.]GGC39178.1 hypothetical protein GCM10011386_34080 [Parapedobacter defluvii]